MIRIESQNALIGIEQRAGQLNIRQNHSPMRLNQTSPKLQLDLKEAVIYIDQRQCFSEAGLKSNSELSRLAAQRGIRAAQQATARIARDGSDMTKIHRGTIISMLSKRRSKPKIKQFNFDMVPKSRPKIDVVEGKFSSYLEKGNINIHVEDFSPKIDYNPTKVDIYLRQKNNIHIEYIGNHLDLYGG
ncbi:DUF6470 family protein [Alkaliphilus transvaalensis]|uniref:DUF6470 family protein n=1 Tax=Alkaliphilus transvaalensis TaxID=114628 RepID=UPI000478BC38|nr:DUF6470 family protein [Alkaliphilus transvaalensis]